MLSKLSLHPNIISYYDSFEVDGTLMIEMEYADGGCVLQHPHSSLSHGFYLIYFVHLSSIQHTTYSFYLIYFAYNFNAYLPKSPLMIRDLYGWL